MESDIAIFLSLILLLLIYVISQLDKEPVKNQNDSVNSGVSRRVNLNNHCESCGRVHNINRRVRNANNRVHVRIP